MNKPRSFLFVADAGATTDTRGKLACPHMLALEISDREHAGDLAKALVAWLAQPSSKARDFIWQTIGKAFEVDEETGEETPMPEKP